MRSYFHNTICTLLLICSKSQTHGDPTVSKYVAVWILDKIVLDAYLFVSYFVFQHNGEHNFKHKLLLIIYRPVLVIRCQTLLEDLWTIWSCCLYVFYEYCYHIPSYYLGSIFYQYIYIYIYIYMVLFLFDNVIYVFLLLWLCILIVCLCLTTLTEVFPWFFLSCKANARVNPAKTGHGPHSS